MSSIPSSHPGSPAYSIKDLNPSFRSSVNGSQRQSMSPCLIPWGKCYPLPSTIISVDIYEMEDRPCKSVAFLSPYLLGPPSAPSLGATGVTTNDAVVAVVAGDVVGAAGATGSCR